MKRVALLSLAFLLVCLPLAMQAITINPVVEYSSSQPGWSDNRPFTLGYSFTTSVSFTINALGAFDDGLGNNREVGIWSSTGTLLVSTTVLGTDPVTGHFQYDPVSYTLAPGSYVIAGEFPGDYVNFNPFPAYATGVVSRAGYTWGTDCQLLGAGLNFPTVCGLGYGANGILYADFSTPGGTPEPGTLIMFGSGIVGLAGVLRRKINL